MTTRHRSQEAYTRHMQAEGWYHDPFKAHDDRWFSDGVPTSLVRDERREATDPPPAPQWDGPLVACESNGTPDDLKRADDPSSGASSPNYTTAALDAGASSGVGWS